MTATRLAAWRDGAANGWHDDLVWYAAAIHQMRLRTPSIDDYLDQIPGYLATNGGPQFRNAMAQIARGWDDPLGLGYQSQVHASFVAKSNWPMVNGQRALWQECAHNHWFFLPWHRAYLLEFEAVARQHISDLGGPAGEWGLPYWNYSDDRFGDQRNLGLPLPLRDDTLPAGVTVPDVPARDDGTFPNPLFNPIRDNQGDPEPGDTSWADARTALLRPHFANQEDTGLVSFGGGVIENPNDSALFHSDTREMGLLDAAPHGSVHMHVGGGMAVFATVGLDPVFWMHHCNIDRLWETYAHDLGHGYPFVDGVGAGTVAQQSWINREFRFLRPGGVVATWTAPQVIDVGALGYGYDATTPPSLPPAPPPPPGAEVDPFGLDVTTPEPIAAAGGFVLAEATEVAVVAGGADDADVSVAAFPDSARWVLRFDGLRTTRPAVTSYHVFLGLPADADPDPTDTAHYVGPLSLFGVFEASRDDGSSSGTGQQRLLDVTDQVLAQADTLRPMDTRVRLVPMNPDRNLADMGLTVERLSLEFA
ncbi:tyrosinase family protein [Gordonia sp. CPCC 205515]|uniref:tyrosinase family protein n=1 Tax=Gordonia sp. CPCC 205515 TaxID=3140791 RepID=UPI003AF3CC7A